MYEVLTSTTSQSAAALQQSVILHGVDARVEHSYWTPCATGWRGMLFLAREPAPEEDDQAPMQPAAEPDPGHQRCARAIEAAFLAVSPHAVLTVVRADPPQ